MGSTRRSTTRSSTSTTSTAGTARPFSPSARCTEHVVDYSQLDADLAAGSVPEYVFITPNLTNDMHDGSIAQGDAWLAREVPKILASDRFKQGGVLFLLWDEGSGHAGTIRRSSSSRRTRRPDSSRRRTTIRARF